MPSGQQPFVLMVPVVVIFFMADRHILIVWVRNANLKTDAQTQFRLINYLNSGIIEFCLILAFP